MGWSNDIQIPPQKWTCAFCEFAVASNRGWADVFRQRSAGGQMMDVTNAYIALCLNCRRPTLLNRDGSVLAPLPMRGAAVGDLPPDIANLYRESRCALSQGAPTASAMAGRKILMNVAVEHGAEKGEDVRRLRRLSRNGWARYDSDAGLGRRDPPARERREP